MSVDSQEFIKINKSNQNDRPSHYFDLIEKVGSHGRYQKKMMLTFIISWFVMGIIMLSNAFIFRNPQFDCIQHGLLIEYEDCTSYVCQLPKEQWSKFISSQADTFNSIATIDNYFCQDKTILTISSSCTYFGAFLGYIILSYCSDRYGRKILLLVSWLICTLGIILVAISFDIYMISIGLFLSGFGGDATINITLLFCSECVSKKNRQKYSVILQIFFPLGAFIVIFFFKVIEEWRIVWCLMIAAPAIIQLALIYCYIQQTPRHLLNRNQVEISMKVLNRIGKINFARRQTLQQQDIQSVHQYQMISKLKQQTVSLLDLLKFPSLRIQYIACSVLAFMIYALYYGPILIRDQTGLDLIPYNLLIQCSQLMAYIPAYLLIGKINRRRAGAVAFTVAASLSFILIFINKPDDCQMCAHAIVQIVIVFVFRSFISFFFCIFNIYVCQLFPQRIRAQGICLPAAVGVLATLASPFYVQAIMDSGLSIFTVFLIFCMVAISCLSLLKQTLKQPLKQQIQQVQEYLQQYRQQMSRIKQSPKIKRRTYKSELPFKKKDYASRVIQSNRIAIE